MKCIEEKPHKWECILPKPWTDFHLQLPTLVSSFWGSQPRRSPGCIGIGRRTRHRVLRPDSRLWEVWRWECYALPDTRSCSRPLEKTTAHLPNTPTYRCHLGVGGEKMERRRNRKRIISIKRDVQSRRISEEEIVLLFLHFPLNLCYCHRLVKFLYV